MGDSRGPRSFMNRSSASPLDPLPGRRPSLLATTILPLPGWTTPPVDGRADRVTDLVIFIDTFC